MEGEGGSKRGHEGWGVIVWSAQVAGERQQQNKQDFDLVTWGFGGDRGRLPAENMTWKGCLVV